MSQRGRNEKAGEPAECPICKKVVRRLGKHPKHLHLALSPSTLNLLLDVVEAAEAYHRRVAEVEANMPPDNSVELLHWAAEEYRLGENLRSALAAPEADHAV